MLSLRRAILQDAAEIAVIYNEAILTTGATFDTELKTVEERTQWLRAHGERHPVLVAVMEGAVVAWSSISPWSDRPAYLYTAETSLYVKEGYRGRGVGRALKQATIEEARRLGYHTLLARIAESSTESLRLNESFGYERVGTLREVGWRAGRWVDVHILQKMLT